MTTVDTFGAAVESAHPLYLITNVYLFAMARGKKLLCPLNYSSEPLPVVASDRRVPAPHLGLVCTLLREIKFELMDLVASAPPPRLSHPPLSPLKILPLR